MFGNRKKPHGAMSGEYGEWNIVTVLFLAKNSRLSNEIWARAKSMNYFSTNTGLLHANGVEPVGTTPYWPFDHEARAQDALCH